MTFFGTMQLPPGAPTKNFAILDALDSKGGGALLTILAERGLPEKTAERRAFLEASLTRALLKTALSWAHLTGVLGEQWWMSLNSGAS